mmetsp:Transcript_81/g.279  ORF Transcript_81/g.279 Transcript_81/m.279 type:complete len:323 (-) Transcript_81:708-1676(-)
MPKATNTSSSPRVPSLSTLSSLSSLLSSPSPSSFALPSSNPAPRSDGGIDFDKEDSDVLVLDAICRAEACPEPASLAAAAMNSVVAAAAVVESVVAAATGHAGFEEIALREQNLVKSASSASSEATMRAYNEASWEYKGTGNQDASSGGPASAGAVDTDAYTLTLRIDIGTDFFALVFVVVVCLALCMWISGLTTRLATRFTDWIEARVVSTSCKFVVALCEDPEVHTAASKLMAAGINQWLAHPETQDHLRSFWAKAPDREVATQLGRHTPVLVKSFVDGFSQQVLYQVAHRVYSDTKIIRSALGFGCPGSVGFIPASASS